MSEADEIRAVEEELKRLQVAMKLLTDLNVEGLSRMVAAARLRQRIAEAEWLWGPDDEAVLNAFEAGDADVTAVAIRVREVKSK